MANAQPIFVRVPRNESVKVITAAPDPNGVSSSKLFQADTNSGSRIHAINALLSGTTVTSTVLRLFLLSSVSYHIIAEVPVMAYTYAQGIAATNINILDYVYAGFLDPTDRYLTLDSGDSLYVSLIDTVESDLHVTAWGGDY